MREGSRIIIIKKGSILVFFVSLFIRDWSYSEKIWRIPMGFKVNLESLALYIHTLGFVSVFFIDFLSFYRKFVNFVAN